MKSMRINAIKYSLVLGISQSDLKSASQCNVLNNVIKKVKHVINDSK